MPFLCSCSLKHMQRFLLHYYHYYFSQRKNLDWSKVTGRMDLNSTVRVASKFESPQITWVLSQYFSQIFKQASSGFYWICSKIAELHTAFTNIADPSVLIFFILTACWNSIFMLIFWNPDQCGTHKIQIVMQKVAEEL